MKVKRILLVEISACRRAWIFSPRREFEGTTQGEIEEAVYDYACRRAYGPAWEFWQALVRESGHGKTVRPVKGRRGTLDGMLYGPRVHIVYEKAQ